MDMEIPKNIIQMRSLQGKIQSIRMFISQLAEKCHSFTRLLHKDTIFMWDEECDQAFTLLKTYLINPPILMPPIKGKLLLLYISTTERSLGVLLAQEDEQGKETTIYYLSRTLIKYELNYTFVERACLAVVFASQKLRHYMLMHKVKLIAKIDPLKYLLSKTALTRRIEKWVMILSEFDIEYVDRKEIKGQVIADHLAENPLTSTQTIQVEFPNFAIVNIEVKTWKLYFDGSYTQGGSRVGILLITPQGYTIPKS